MVMVMRVTRRLAENNNHAMQKQKQQVKAKQKQILRARPKRQSAIRLHHRLASHAPAAATPPVRYG